MKTRRHTDTRAEWARKNKLLKKRYLLARNIRLPSAFLRLLPQSEGREEPSGKMTFSKAVFLYVLGGLVGTVWETLLNLFRGRGFVFCNGSIFTPFNFVYGVGAVVIILLLKNRKKWWQVFLIGSLGGGLVEYILSFLEEAVLGTRSWNYSHKFLNINGRTTVPYMIFWGLLCLAVIYIVYRPLDNWLETFPKKAMKIAAIVLFCLIAIDWMVTVSALIRYSARAEGTAAATFIGEWIDRVFDDAFMKRRFPAMKIN